MATCCADAGRCPLCQRSPSRLRRLHGGAVHRLDCHQSRRRVTTAAGSPGAAASISCFRPEDWRRRTSSRSTSRPPGRASSTARSAPGCSGWSTCWLDWLGESWWRSLLILVQAAAAARRVLELVGPVANAEMRCFHGTRATVSLGRYGSEPIYGAGQFWPAPRLARQADEHVAAA